ncbi:unnamed protein product [Bursaphelenchus xylophilus]|uniref:(pine wood nematode) hypothetical protein n=1 Tax=Bursaphelenchus xylophilus TaxID=6326 RepID=A0A1I7S345_BURXY|nr:unnamed protein product [Bursaphelenchus xylophilus]CAG9116091.1 unnamed protein product [Bursaphelenchus xylophilus]
MSRVIIKNLPSKCSEDEIRKFFKDYQPVTDVSLKFTKDGVFRKFAFVGFDSDEKAKAVINKFNCSFFGTSRITVEECSAIEEKSKIRPWSKYSKGSNAYKRIHGDDSVLDNMDVKKSKKENQVLNKYEKDPLFADFLKVRGVKIEKKAEENSEEDSGEVILKAIETYKGDKNVSLIFRGLPLHIKQTNLKEWLSPIRIRSCFFVQSSTEAFAFVEFNRPADMKKALQRTDQFLGGFKVRICRFPEEKNDTKEGEKHEEIDFEAERKKLTDKILETGRLFLRNLPYICNEDDLTFLFKKFGEIVDIQCIVNRQTGQCKGFAVITFMFPENALTAYTELDGTVFKGRMLHILPGEEKPDVSEDQTNEKVLSKFQKEKNAKQKENSGRAFSWNTLFLGANAVADTLAEKLNIQKSQFLEGDDKNSAAVRMSLAETRLVNETRDFLVNNGVCLDAFSRPASKRSDTVIIVKNLPSGTDSEELKRMFERFGEVKRFLLPPECKVTGIVEFKLSSDAKKSFKNLAYSKYKTQPLYLEWAPIDVFSDNGKEKQVVEEKITPGAIDLNKKEKREIQLKKKYGKKVGQDVEAKEESEEEVKEEVEEGVKQEEVGEEGVNVNDGRTLFVKNLNFETTDEVLTKFFAKKYKLDNAQVSKKAEKSERAGLISMGFGFITFKTAEEAEKALRNHQGALLEGHAIELKRSRRQDPLKSADSLKRKEVTTLEQGECTKILVRNIPFQASEKEVTALFTAFGEIKTVRLPKKVASTKHRGFAFVDFISKLDAKKAFDSLVHSTHMYGRRLVLEWAKESETVDEIRERTNKKFNNTNKGVKMTRRKIRGAVQEGMDEASKE